ncbi:methionine aminopeptidase [Amanita muscaria]
MYNLPWNQCKPSTRQLLWFFRPWKYHTRLANILNLRRLAGFRIQPYHDPNATEELLDPDDDLPDFGEYSVILPPEPFSFGVSHIKPRKVPDHILKPSYVDITCKKRTKHDRVVLGTESEAHIREAGKLAKRVRVRQVSRLGIRKVGTTTNAIDSAIHDFIIAHGAYPSPLLYNGFPKSCCTSVNNVIAHGIPDERPLEDGDIINIDITVYLNGYHGDTSETFLVGNVDAKGKSLVATSLLALHAGISICAPGRPFKSIGQAIHDSVHQSSVNVSAEEDIYSINTQLTGHGIGTDFHKQPWIVHDINEEPGIMVPGDCFTIEPSIVQGSNPRGWIFPDGWTMSTENCARSAQAEHTVLITDTGADVLTS